MVGSFASFEVVRLRLTEASLKDLLNLRALGFALNRAWVYLVFLGAGASFITWGGGPAPSETFVISSISLCLTLFGAAFLRKKIGRFIGAPWLNYGAPFLVAIGTLFISSSPLPDMPTSLFVAGGGILTGVGSGVIDLAYGERYRNVDPSKTLLEIPFAFLVAALTYFLVLRLSSVVACVATAMLPLASGAILVFLGRKDTHESETIPSAEIDEGRFALKLGACACLVGIADGVVRAAFIEANAVEVLDFFLLPLPLSGILSMAIIYGCVLFTKKQDIRNIYRSVMLIMAFFFMLLPVFLGSAIIEGAIALTGYGTFNVLIWVLIAGISQRYRISSLTAFGIGWGMVTLGVLAGSLVGSVVCDQLSLTPQTMSLIALLATMAILVSYMFVFREEDLVELIKGPDDSPDSVDQQNRFERRCELIAEEYGLTAREAEVMSLIARGRSNKRIQEELFISRGTCSTHTRHIYQKLGLHDRQDLIDLIEDRLER